MLQPIFTLTIINTQKKDKKTLKISLLRKLISPLNVQANKRKYEKPFKSISWSVSETLV